MEFCALKNTAPRWKAEVGVQAAVAAATHSKHMYICMYVCIYFTLVRKTTCNSND